jgi:3-oxoadipate enol-lactonase
LSDVVLIHAGIADSRMWAPQLQSFAREHRVLAPDLPGFGETPIETDAVDLRAFVRSALDAAGVDRAALVGASLGGRTALELALETPERVSALVLVGAGVADHDWSEEVHAFGAEEDEALERGDRDAATDLNLRMWLAGPRRRLGSIEPRLRELVADMQRRAFELQRERPLRIAPLHEHELHEVTVPTLVVTGDEDVGDIHTIADRLVREIPGAERATIADTAHLPNLERPDEFDRIVLGFLRQHAV